MREYFLHQFTENKVVTQEALDQVTLKTYTSGREIKPGEIILFAFAKDDKNTAELICLHEDELEQYEYVQNPTEFIPEIKLKQVI
jgi:uncharacterized protein YciU (UPF0263 family)